MTIGTGIALAAMWASLPAIIVATKNDTLSAFAITVLVLIAGCVTGSVAAYH